MTSNPTGLKIPERISALFNQPDAYRERFLPSRVHAEDITCGISDPGHSYAPLRVAQHVHPVPDDTFATRRDAFLKERLAPATPTLPSGWHLIDVDRRTSWRLVRKDGHAIFANIDPDKWLAQIASHDASQERTAQSASHQQHYAEECQARAAAIQQPTAPSLGMQELLVVTQHAAQQLGKMASDPFPIGDCFDQLQTEYHKLLSSIDGPFGYKRRIEELHTENTMLQAAVLRAHPPLMKVDGMITRWNADMGCWETCAMPDAKPDDGPKADYHGPDDAAHRAIHEAAEHLLGGRVTDTKARRGLRDALDKADRPAAGRTASDQAIGRATRMPDATMSSVEPGHRYDPATNRTYGVPVCQGFGVPDPVKTAAAPSPSAKPPLPAWTLGRSTPQIGLRLP